MYSGIKEILKNKLPSIYFLYQFRKKNKIIRNYFKKNNSRNALLSYILKPFVTNNSYGHTNYFEAHSWAKILDEFNYNVDIIDRKYCKLIDFSKYDLLCGFGNAFQQYYESPNTFLTTIYYSTGAHVIHNNYATLERVKDVYQKKGVWLGKSSRYVERMWTHQTLLVDAIITLDGGNGFVEKSYRKYYDGPIYTLPVPAYKIFCGNEIIKNRNNNSKKNYLWFGSSGLIHKGLDLVLDYFSKNKMYNLHICGPINNEAEFIKVYDKELKKCDNIYAHGYIDIKTEDFKEILGKCDFVIFPSVSEGGGAGIYNCIINGGLIPIVTGETSISTGYEIKINDFSFEGIERAVKKSQRMSEKKIKSLRFENYKYAVKSHGNENYYSHLKKYINNILN